MQFVSKMLVAMATLIASALALAGTTQFSPAATVTATKDAAGNAMVVWTDGIQVSEVEHYVSHGQRGGFVQKIAVGAAKQAVLRDLPKNGGRFNLRLIDGNYLHLECGGNDRTTMPTFTGLRVDCSYTDPGTGQKVGALVVN